MLCQRDSRHDGEADQDQRTDTNPSVRDVEQKRPINDPAQQKDRPKNAECRRGHLITYLNPLGTARLSLSSSPSLGLASDGACAGEIFGFSADRLAGVSMAE